MATSGHPGQVGGEQAAKNSNQDRAGDRGGGNNGVTDTGFGSGAQYGDPGLDGAGAPKSGRDYQSKQAQRKADQQHERNVASQGGQGGSFFSRAFDALTTPVTEDPVLNGVVQSIPVVGMMAKIASLLDAAGVPNTPPNTSGAYQNAQGRDIRGQGKSGIGTALEASQTVSVPPIEPIGYQKVTEFSSANPLPVVKQVPIYPRLVQPNQQMPTAPSSPSSRIVNP